MKYFAVTIFLSLVAQPIQAATYLIAAANNLGRPDEPALRYAERDAVQIRDVLKKVGAFDDLREQLLLGGGAAAVEQAIASAPLAPGDALIVFFSGHADGDGLHLGSSTLPFPRLKALVERSGARVKLLIVDACRSGQITETKGAHPAPLFAIALEDRLEVEGMAIVTSSAGSEDSQESDQLRGSFFTHHLVHGLLGAADRDRDGRVTLQEAYAYAFRETLRSTGRTRALQHPTYAYDLAGRGDLVLTQLSSDRRSAVLSIAEPGSYLVFDSADSLFAELYIEEPNARYLLPAGEWLIQRREGDRVSEHELTLTGGEERVLSSQGARTVPLTRLVAKGRADDGREHRVFFLAGARGSVVQGFGAAPSLWAGYRRNLSDFEVGFDLDLARDGSLHRTYGLRGRIERAFDFGIGRAGGGLFLEATLHDQRWPARARQLYGGFGAIAFAELKLSGPWTFRLEGGPALYLVKRVSGAVDQLGAPIDWWIAGGPTWGF